MFVTDVFPVPMMLAGVAACATRAGRRVAGWIRRGAGIATRSRGMSIAGVAIFAIAAAAAYSTFVRRPLPAVHDEFSYLLSADTFAQGRLTNPTPAMWRHLETIHEIMQPTYASKYPPGPGLVMALGQVITGRPIVGVWLAAGAGAAAVYWMMLGWMPRRWALLGALLVTMDGPVFQWSQGYWGGSLAMAGGALVVGAWIRLMERPRVGAALWLGIGTAILANTRPFEGLLVLAPVLAILGWRWISGMRWPGSAAGTRRAGSTRSDIRSDILWRLAVPWVAVAGVSSGLMLMYNKSVTGHALTMPYMIHEEQVATVPSFLFQSLRPAPAATAYAFDEIRDQHLVYERKFYDQGRAQPVSYLLDKVSDLCAGGPQSGDGFFGGMGLPFALAALPWLLRRDRRAAWAVVMLLPLGAGVAVETFMHSHYVAPGVGLVFLVLMQSLRYLCTWQRGRRVGQMLAWAVVLISAHGEFTSLHQLAHGIWGDREIARPRQHVVDFLSRQPGKQLVLVRYPPDHGPETEWVYNAADIDGSKIVWAHDLPGGNAEIRDYYRDRTVWLLEVANKPAADIIPVPYPSDRP